ncbi:uncharacterized protein B0I36DRAFT_331254 [Microdochium trichocladiopsis]|uniref:Uncharacterized protein n=1 Tax=Microdochium trichocladiopsis TaxID=1682393 RepID=A0A9P8XYC1_9PEZI|nr:uncharacterized protein B0I36DRAFT_331254 [Microdochium trichocladiopsis]KAH7024330.1 hypothetical protein B0I36DRAFT_331254 [Microdochium trichocladiopsis]
MPPQGRGCEQSTCRPNEPRESYKSKILMSGYQEPKNDSTDSVHNSQCTRRDSKALTQASSDITEWHIIEDDGDDGDNVRAADGEIQHINCGLAMNEELRASKKKKARLEEEKVILEQLLEEHRMQRQGKLQRCRLTENELTYKNTETRNIQHEYVYNNNSRQDLAVVYHSIIIEVATVLMNQEDGQGLPPVRQLSRIRAENYWMQSNIIKG